MVCFRIKSLSSEKNEDKVVSPLMQGEVALVGMPLDQTGSCLANVPK